MPADASAIERAYLVTYQDRSDANKRIKFDFNPASLTYTIEAAAPPQQPNAPSRAGQAQANAQFSSKLSFDAVFDNTDTGEDVRNVTQSIAAFLKPAPAQGEETGVDAPSLILFHWGALLFTGVLIQYREGIEFFSKEGVPLRSTLSLTFVKQEVALHNDPHQDHAAVGGSIVPTGSGDSALSAATRGGDPRAARALASANSLESLRFTGGLSLEVGGGANVSAGFGLNAGGSVEASASWNGSGSGALFGSQSSAQVSASAGAFSGLGAHAAVSAGTLNPGSMLSGGSTADLSVHAGASFSLGGAAQMGVGVGLSADVGATASWRDLLQFDDEG